MCEYNIEPDIRFDLSSQVRELQRADRLNWRVVFRKRFKEADNTLRDTSLLAALVNINRWWVEEENLSIGVFLLFRLLLERFELWIDGKNGADLQL